MRAQPTVVLLEAAWVDGFTPEAGLFRPQTSVAPFLATLDTWVPTRVLHRQLRTAADLECWCRALSQAPLGPKIVFLAAHGWWKVGSHHRAIDLRAPDHVRSFLGNRISAADIRRSLAHCGPVGVMVLACGFGKNEPTSWLPPTVTWALAFGHAVDWFEAALYCTRAITWCYSDSAGAPRTAAEAHRRYRLGVLTGRNGWRYRYDHRAIASALGARFFWRRRDTWQVCDAPEFR